MWQDCLFSEPKRRHGFHKNEITVLKTAMNLRIQADMFRKFRIVVFVMGIVVVWCGQNVAAESVKPFPEFQAKRIKPPQRGVKKRINVQIAPAAPKVVAAPAPTASKKPQKLGSYAWFWKEISAEASASKPGRLEKAMAVLAGASRKVTAPRLQDLQNLTKAHGVDILKATIGTKVSPALVLAVISVESGGKSDAQSSAGAQGLMQLMPATATRFGVQDRLVPSQNISGGVQYLDWLSQKFSADPILVLAGYNAGEGSVRDHKGVPPFAETRDYVPKVLAAFQVAKGLCQTPPELISDGCVFTVMK